MNLANIRGLWLAILGLFFWGCGDPLSSDLEFSLSGVWQAQEVVYVPTAINTIAFIRKDEYYENNIEGRMVQVGTYEVIRIADTTFAGAQMKNHTVRVGYLNNQDQIQLVIGTTQNILEIHVHENSSRFEGSDVSPRGPRPGVYYRLHSGEGF